MLWTALTLALASADDAPRQDPPPILDDAHSHTVRAADESEAELKISSARHARARLLEIDAELFPLLVRPSVGAVFVDSMKRLWPWMGIGLIPLAGGLVLGLGGQRSLTVPLSTEQAAIYPALGIGGFVVTGLLIGIFSVLSHFIDEADGAPARQQRIDALRLERDQLSVAIR